MANEFTSIATAGGWSGNTVKGAWDLAFRVAANALPACVPFIDVQPERPTHQGDSVTLQIKNYYSEAAITAAKTALTEEVDVDSTKLPATSTVVLTPVERGAANSRTLKVANRSMVPVDPWIAEALADWSVKTHDEFLQDRMVAGTNVTYASTAVSTVTVGSTMYLTAAKLRLAKTKMDALQARPRDGVNYVGLFHPNVVYDIRSETGSGSWRNPSEYGTSQTQIWNGEIGTFEGVRFIQNARLRKATDGVGAAVVVYRSFLLGKEALAKAEVTPAGVKLGPTTDKLGRFRHIGWYSDLDYQIFRQEALHRLESASAAT